MSTNQTLLVVALTIICFLLASIAGNLSKIRKIKESEVDYEEDEQNMQGFHYPELMSRLIDNMKSKSEIIDLSKPTDQQIRMFCVEQAAMMAANPLGGVKPFDEQVKSNYDFITEPNVPDDMILKSDVIAAMRRKGVYDDDFEELIRSCK